MNTYKVFPSTHVVEKSVSGGAYAAIAGSPFANDTVALQAAHDDSVDFDKIYMQTGDFYQDIAVTYTTHPATIEDPLYEEVDQDFNITLFGGEVKKAYRDVMGFNVGLINGALGDQNWTSGVIGALNAPIDLHKEITIEGELSDGDRVSVWNVPENVEANWVLHGKKVTIRNMKFLGHTARNLSSLELSGTYSISTANADLVAVGGALLTEIPNTVDGDGDFIPDRQTFVTLGGETVEIIEIVTDDSAVLAAVSGQTASGLTAVRDRSEIWRYDGFFQIYYPFILENCEIDNFWTVMLLMIDSRHVYPFLAKDISGEWNKDLRNPVESHIEGCLFGDGSTRWGGSGMAEVKIRNNVMTGGNNVSDWYKLTTIGWQADYWYSGNSNAEFKGYWLPDGMLGLIDSDIQANIELYRNEFHDSAFNIAVYDGEDDPRGELLNLRIVENTFKGCNIWPKKFVIRIDSYGGKMLDAVISDNIVDGVSLDPDSPPLPRFITSRTRGVREKESTEIRGLDLVGNKLTACPQLIKLSMANEVHGSVDPTEVNIAKNDMVDSNSVASDIDREATAVDAYSGSGKIHFNHTDLPLKEDDSYNVVQDFVITDTGAEYKVVPAGKKRGLTGAEYAAQILSEAIALTDDDRPKHE